MIDQIGLLLALFGLFGSPSAGRLLSALAAFQPAG
jgi:hypothetical protein